MSNPESTSTPQENKSCCSKDKKGCCPVSCLVKFFKKLFGCKSEGPCCANKKSEEKPEGGSGCCKNKPADGKSGGCCGGHKH